MWRCYRGINDDRTPGYQVKIIYFIFRAVFGFKKVQNIFCKMHNKMFKSAYKFCINCILRSLWEHLKPSKSQWFSTICSLWTMHQSILHDFSSGGVVPHNTSLLTTRYPRLLRGASNGSTHSFKIDYTALLWQKEASDIPSKFELLMFS